MSRVSAGALLWLVDRLIPLCIPPGSALLIVPFLLVAGGWVVELPLPELVRALLVFPVIGAVLGLWMAMLWLYGVLHMARQTLLRKVGERSAQRFILLLRPLERTLLTHAPYVPIRLDPDAEPGPAVASWCLVRDLEAGLRSLALPVVVGDLYSLQRPGDVLGMPEGEQHPLALLARVSDEDWFECIEQLVPLAWVVVVIPGASTGLTRELGALRDANVLERTLLYVPPAWGAGEDAAQRDTDLRSAAQALADVGVSLPQIGNNGLACIARREGALGSAIQLPPRSGRRRLRRALSALCAEIPPARGTLGQAIEVIRPFEERARAGARRRTPHP